LNSYKKKCTCSCIKPCGVVPVSKVLVAIEASEVPPPVLPGGIIVMWSGLITNIPTGWVLCDGANGTPDLSDRFVMGTTSDSEIGDIGGSNSISLSVSQLPPHSHDGSTDIAGNHTHTATTNLAGNHTHTATTNLAGSHTHTGNTDEEEDHRHRFGLSTFVTEGIVGLTDGDRSYANGTNLDAFTGLSGRHSHTLTTDSNGDHVHTVTVDSNGDHVHTVTVANAGLHDHSFNTNNTGNGEPINITNSYYKLAFIMKL